MGKGCGMEWNAWRFLRLIALFICGFNIGLGD